MSDDVIEDEANERDIRRIRRARLAATDDWCDDCHGYTHMPYCPAYVEPAGNKHKGDVMERREQQLPRLDYHVAENAEHPACLLIEEESGLTVATFPNSARGVDNCLELLNDHNQHAALVEQRDALTRMLANVIDANYGASYHHIGDGDGIPAEQAKEIQEWWQAYLQKVRDDYDREQRTTS